MATGMSSAAILPPQPISPSPGVFLQATPTHTDHQPTIFDLLGDPRQTIKSIEAFVLACPSCVTSVSPHMGWTPLHDAARKADTKLIRFFLDQGAVLEAQGHVGETPLMVACEVIPIIGQCL